MENDPTRVPIRELVEAHAQKSGGWKQFIHSNLFTALVMWTLSQALLLGGLIVSFYFKVSSLTEWKGGMSNKVEALEKWRDDQKLTVQDNSRRISVNENAIGKLQQQTEHVDVWEFENRRITEDIERLKNERK